MKSEARNNKSQKWMDCMRRGDFESAWQVSDAVMREGKGELYWQLPRHLQNVWGGSPVDGKRVLVRCYHGLGDTIQFIRYAKQLKMSRCQVVVWAQQELLPLLSTIQFIDEAFPIHEGSPEMTYDVDVEVMELPYVYRTTCATIPSEVPYLNVAPLSLGHNEKHSVGLVWKAGEWDPGRSIPFDALAPLRNLKGITLFVLQSDAAGAGWEEGFGTYPGDRPLYQYARILKGLDLLISVDSMPVHLAGAMGVPVWTLLQRNADWRWMDSRDDSPWYPSMRLIRQKEQGDWQGVILKVARELRRFFSQYPARTHGND